MSMNPPPSTCGGQIPALLHLIDGGIGATLNWDGMQYWTGCTMTNVYGGNPNATQSSYLIAVPLVYYLRFDGVNFWLRVGYPTQSASSIFPQPGLTCSSTGWTGLSGFPNYGSNVIQGEWGPVTHQFNQGILYLIFDAPYCQSTTLTRDPCWNYFIWYHNIYNVPCGTNLNQYQTEPPIYIFSNANINGPEQAPPLAGVQMCGEAFTEYGLLFRSNGLGIIGPYFTALRTGGTIGYRLGYRAKGHGGPVLASTTRVGVSRYIYIPPSAGVMVLGTALVAVAHWSYTFSQHDVNHGGVDIRTGGAGVLFLSYDYNAGIGTGILIAGTSRQGSQSNYPSSGGVTVTGQAKTLGAVYHYTPRGGIAVSGLAGIYNSNHGVVVASGGGSAALVPLVSGQLVSIGYDESAAANDLVAADTSITTACDCNALPGVLQLSHPIGAGGSFSTFLYINSLTIPASATILYGGEDAGWRANYHFSGSDPNTGIPVRWGIIFEWACTTVIGGIDLGTPVWKFGMLARRQLAGYPPQNTRLLMTFSSTGPCVQGVVNFQFSYNVITNTVTTSPGRVTNDVVYHDGIGMFGQPYYATNPTLNFQVAVQQTTTSVTQLSQGVVFPPSATYPEA